MFAEVNQIANKNDFTGAARMKIKTMIALAIAIVFSSTAMAMPITGTISWEGKFSRSGDVFSFSGVEIGEATNDFAQAGFTHNDALSVASIDIGAFTQTVLWVENGITFTLDSLNVELDIPFLTALSGSATLSGAGFDATPFSFFFSTSSTNFSASAVPEPGMGLLLLSGLIAVGALRRRAIKTS